MKDLVLGIDCSTTASKVLAWDHDGKSHGEGRAPLTEIRPSAAYSEQVAEGWWDATLQALRQVVKAVETSDQRSSCITHQRESYAPVDTDNRSLRYRPLFPAVRTPLRRTR